MGMQDGLAQDWVTIWQSEISVLAADRELQEAWARGAAQWAALTRQALAYQPLSRDPPDGPAGRPGPAASAGAAAADAASLAALERRVAELERQLARRV